MMESRISKSLQRAGRLAVIVLLAAGRPEPAAAADFQIVWVVVGEAAASDGQEPMSVGRHLFMAADLAAFALKRITISQVAVEPVVTHLAVGERFCLDSLRFIAYGPDRSMVERAPVSVSVRQDYRDGMGLERSKRNICMTPTIAGEYPIRFTSLVPAVDGSTRGAQIFVRVR
ncbi:MAG TPA: hypothetical protein VNQ81_10865 [Povalibacter sp.]|nr:hypothetical protein [Povalibacter sp.]